jgi:hypothetical protein
MEVALLNNVQDNIALIYRNVFKIMIFCQYFLLNTFILIFFKFADIFQ